MHDILVARDIDFPWKDGKTLPADRFVLARVSHCTNPRRAKLVFARAVEDGVALASGGELSFDWSVSGWLEQDIEIDLQPLAATSAAFAPLAWTETQPGKWFASDGLGGEYSYDEARDIVRYDADDCASFFADGAHRDAAQAHHEARLRGRITNKEASA